MICTCSIPTLRASVAGGKGKKLQQHSWCPPHPQESLPCTSLCSHLQSYTALT